MVGRLSHPAPLGPRARRPLRQHGGENKALGRPASAGGGCVRQSTGLVAGWGGAVCRAVCVRACERGPGQINLSAWLVLSWSMEPSGCSPEQAGEGRSDVKWKGESPEKGCGRKLPTC